VTRSLLGHGVPAIPFSVVVGLVQALIRTGFDLAHDNLPYPAAHWSPVRRG
jgi:hypothetical protein